MAEEPDAKIAPLHTCTVVVKKDAGKDEDVLCGEPASCKWPILADDDVTVLDFIFACPLHESKYDEGHTILARDTRGFIYMFGLEPGKFPEDEKPLTSDATETKIEGE